MMKYYRHVFDHGRWILIEDNKDGTANFKLDLSFGCPLINGNSGKIIKYDIKRFSWSEMYYRPD